MMQTSPHRGSVGNLMPDVITVALVTHSVRGEILWLETRKEFRPSSEVRGSTLLGRLAMKDIPFGGQVPQCLTHLPPGPISFRFHHLPHQHTGD